MKRMSIAAGVWKRAGALALGVLLSLPSGVAAQETVTLKQCITRALATAPELEEAQADIEVENPLKDQARDEIVVKVKEYYYGVLLARELKSLLGEVSDDLSTTREKARKLLDRNSINVEESDMYKFEALNGEVQKYLAEAKKGEVLALAALQTEMGMLPGAKMELADKRLARVNEQLGELYSYFERAKVKRSEFRRVSEGLQAGSEQVPAAKVGPYPDSVLGGNVSWALAERRDRVHDSRVPDENVPRQIRKYYEEGVQAAGSIDAAKLGYESSKKWAMAAIANFDFGVGPAKEIFDSLQQYAKMRAAYFQSIYDYDMAIANLRYAVGAGEE